MGSPCYDIYVLKVSQKTTRNNRSRRTKMIKVESGRRHLAIKGEGGAEEPKNIRPHRPHEDYGRNLLRPRCQRRLTPVSYKISAKTLVTTNKILWFTLQKCVNCLNIAAEIGSIIIFFDITEMRRDDCVVEISERVIYR
jgi:hypothetical protein